MSRRVMGFAVGALVTVLAGAVCAQDEIDRTPEDCLSVSRIRSTEIVDDRTILFYMRKRSEAYLNELPRDCPRLERAGRFAYEARGGRLCRSDTITVLETFGARFERGATCRLGDYVPLTRAEALEIEAGPEAPGERDVGVSEVELPDDDEGGAARGDSDDAAAPATSDE